MVQGTCCSMTYRVNDSTRDDKLEEFITAHQLLVSTVNKMKRTDNLLRQVLLKSLKSKAKIIINDFNASHSTQENKDLPEVDNNPVLKARSLFDDEDNDDGIFVTI